MTGTMTNDADGIRRTRLDSGLRVVTEHLPGLRSAAVGFWVGTGSRDEAESVAGSSHFLEHLLFKGSETRHAQEIAEAVESCGGDMNAFTGQEITAYYVRVPDRHLDLALDILSDIVWTPALRPDEVESERQVILEEIKMRDDTPDDLVHDVFAGALFPDHPLGREISGSEDTISAVTRDQIAEYHAAHYVPSNVVVAVAGNVDHDEVVERLSAALPTTDAVRPARVNGADHGTPEKFARVDRPLEQSHIVLGARAAARRSRPLRAVGRRPGARRRDELTPVPGGAREARPRLLGVLLPERVRRDGRDGGVLRDRARARRGDPRRRAHRARPPGRRGRRVRARARRSEGPPHRLAGVVAGELVEPHEPHGPHRADHGRDPQSRLGRRAGRRGHPRRREPGHRPRVRRRGTHPSRWWVPPIRSRR